MLMKPIATGENGDPVRLVVAAVATLLLGWAFLAVNKAGQIALSAGPRLARGTFDVDRATDPAQFYGALAVIGALFLIALAAATSSLWSIVAAARHGTDPEQ